jgi:cystathionine beta-lyase family protein involved in aluminum resistance
MGRGVRKVTEDAEQRRRFMIIKVTHESAPEPEQQAMLNELRFKLSTVPLGERTEMISNIQFEIGQRMIDFMR